METSKSNEETKEGTNSPTREETSNVMSIEQLNMKINMVELKLNYFMNQMNSQINNFANSIATLSQTVSNITHMNDLKQRMSSGQHSNSPQKLQLPQPKTLSKPITKKAQIPNKQPSPKKPTYSSTVKGKEIIQVNQPLKLHNSPSQKSKLKEQYKYFQLLISRLNQNSISSPTIKYISHYAINKAVIFRGTNPQLVNTLFSYGLIYCLYPSENLSEISQLPKSIQDSAAHYINIVTQGSMYIRFYSTIAEIVPEKYYAPLNLIKYGTTKKSFEFKEEQKEAIDKEEFSDTISRIRAQELEIIFAEMSRTLTCDKAQWTYFVGTNTCIYSIGRTSRQSRQFNMFYNRIKNNTMDNTEETKRRICQILKEYSIHNCKYCKEKEEIEELPTSFNILDDYQTKESTTGQTEIKKKRCKDIEARTQTKKIRRKDNYIDNEDKKGQRKKDETNTTIKQDKRESLKMTS